MAEPIEQQVNGVQNKVIHDLRLSHGWNNAEATRKAMDELGGAVILIAVVLTTVFVPTALVSTTFRRQ